MTETCLIAKCSNPPVNSRGWCSKHYQRWRKYGDPEYTKNYENQKCSVEGCNLDAKKKEMCKFHYQRMSRTGTTVDTDTRFYGTTEERFWHYTQKQENGCWLWTGPKTTTVRRPGAKPFTYGLIYVSETGKFERAHRWGYKNFVENIPDELHVDHVCRFTLCVNWLREDIHLEAVTNQENTLRGELSLINVQRAVERTHCPQNHPYSGYNLIITGRQKVCRQCKNNSRT